MALVYFLAVTVALHLSFAMAEETNEVPDSFKIFESFPFAVAISDSDNDNVYECLSTRRMWIKPEEKKGEYVWFLQGNHDNRKRTISFYVFKGTSPDTFLFTVGSGDSPCARPTYGSILLKFTSFLVSKKDEALSSKAKFHYTDYENCAVLDLPYNGRQRNEHNVWPPE
ncbi:uncharacterized protein LOC119182538 isoform X3 [Rhipicephalus microplus]|uniref:uncharacterized protein LOC119182538 isoform X3 n=1 Tax=Rhipicephalus microplus TaxID=6941 RepID=UPI003F6B22F1